MMNKLIAALAIVVFCNPIFSADEVIGWRTDGSGSYQVKSAPLIWSDTDNVVWRQKMPAWSNTSPVIVGDKIFTCAEPATLLCLNKKDGSILWQAASHYVDTVPADEAKRIEATMKEVEPVLQELKDIKDKMRKLRGQVRKEGDNGNAKVEMEKVMARDVELKEKLKGNDIAAKYEVPDTHKDNGFCSYIPVSDGQHIYAAFGLGTLSCFDLNGKRIWSVLSQKPATNWGGSTSPVLAGDLVIVGFKDYIAYDKKTGKEVWHSKMSASSYGSPIVISIGKDQVIITPQGAALLASDGSVIDDSLFTTTPYNAPIIQDGILYVVGGKENECAAIKVPDTVTGEFEKLWQVTVDKDRYYSSPLFHDGLLYIIHRNGKLSVLDASNGSILNSITVKGFNRNGVYTSPTFAAGNIYCGDDAGLVVIIEAGKDLKEIGRNKQERTRCSPIFENAQMFIRTNDHLLCVQAP